MMVQRRAANRSWGPELGDGAAVQGAEQADDDQIDRELIALLRRNLAAAGQERAGGGARRSLSSELARLRPDPAVKTRKSSTKKKAAQAPEVPPDAGGLDRPPEGFKPPSRELPVRPPEKKPSPKGQKPAQPAHPAVSRKPEVPRTSARSKSAPGERGRKQEDANGKGDQQQANTDGEEDAEDAAKAAKRAEVRRAHPR